MSFLIPIALFGWPFASVLFFSFTSPRNAVLFSLLGAWLFLPMASYSFPGIPDYGKMTAASFGAILGTAIYVPTKIAKLKSSLLDIPMAVFCISPLLSSLSNGLGAYDGLSGCLGQFTTWGLPYLIGRIHFDSLESVAVLTKWLFYAGLVYLPFCLIEVRMSPQLHSWVYGYFQHSFAQTRRLGGWRPVVFMQHGLMVGMWMCMTSLIGIGLWKKRLPKSLFGQPVIYFIVGLMITAILCRSTGAIVLLALGWIVLVGMKSIPSWFWLIGLSSIAPVYMSCRISGWSGESLLRALSYVSERDKSLEFRMKNEDLLIDKAMKSPLFGWGGWGRNRVKNDQGKDISVTDGLWTIVLGTKGFLGLVSISLVFILPVWVYVFYQPSNQWLNYDYISPTLLAVVCSLYWIDCLPNAMINPIFTLCIAALVGVCGLREPEQVRVQLT
jgi:hypothetical protein